MTTPNMPLDCDGLGAALADYLEGDATDAVRSAVNAHAAACAACRALLDDLSAIRTGAASLPLLTPSRDLWNGIGDRIAAPVLPMETPRRATDIPRWRAWSRPAVAAAALVVITAGVTHYATRVSLETTASAAATQVAVATTPRVDSSAQIVSSASAVPASEQPVTTEAPARRSSAPVARLASTDPILGAAEPVFNVEIGKLRRIVRERRSELDPGTIAVLEQSIAVIDSAIAQSRAALARDPASGFLVSQLNRSLEKKVELLRTAALLPART